MSIVELDALLAGANVICNSTINGNVQITGSTSASPCPSMVASGTSAPSPQGEDWPS